MVATKKRKKNNGKTEVTKVEVEQGEIVDESTKGINSKKIRKEASFRHLNQFLEKYGKEIVGEVSSRKPKMLSPKQMITFVESALTPEGNLPKMAYLLPLMHFMNKTQLTIHDVSFSENAKGEIKEAKDYFKSKVVPEFRKGEKVHDHSVLVALDKKYNKVWWKIPAYDYEKVAKIIDQNEQCVAVLMAISKQTFNDKESGKPVVCLVPRFRYYAESEVLPQASEKKAYIKISYNNADETLTSAPKPEPEGPFLVSSTIYDNATTE